MEDSGDEQVKTLTNDKSAQSSSIWKIFIPSRTTWFLIAYFILGLLMNGKFKPFIKHGFFCNDSSLNYPHTQDTIGIKFLFVSSLIVPGLVIKLCDKRLKRLLKRSPHHVIYRSQLSGKLRKISETVCPKNNKTNHEEEGKENEEEEEKELMINDNQESTEQPRHKPLLESDNELNENFETSDKLDEEIDLFTRIPLSRNDELHSRRDQNLHSRNRHMARTVGEFHCFFFGLATTVLLTGLGKITCGRLRPHFMQRCQPDINCLDPKNINRYITDFNCTNPSLDSYGMNYISTSWPSGHASIIFYSMFYLIMYLNSTIPILLHFSTRQVKRGFNPLTIYTIYVLMVGLACFIALTRVSDYHHHPLDVCSGAVIGTFIALLWTLSQSRAHLKPFYQNSNPSKQVVNLSRGC